MDRPLLDDDGENLPVRWFLAAYKGGSVIKIMAMKTHLANCGYPFWPDWCDGPDHELTKGGAQSWLRYLFDLEKKE